MRLFASIKKYKELIEENRNMTIEIDKLRTRLEKAKKDNKELIKDKEYFIEHMSNLRQKMNFLIKREKKLQLIEMMYKNDSVDLEELSYLIKTP